MHRSRMKRFRRNGAPADSGRTKAKVQIVYQTIDGLHKACPGHPGDWYFSGDYPTAGGNYLVNKAFIDYVENSDIL